MKRLLLLAFLSATTSIFGQYAYKEIPAPLTVSTNAVIRNETTEVVLNRYNKVHVSIERVVTVLNKNGLSAIGASFTYDGAKSIKNIEATLFDKNGERIKRFKEKDFTDVSASEGYMYVDNRRIFLEFVPPAYPFTMVYTLEYTSSNTPLIQPFQPIRWTKVGIEKSTYRFSNESKVPIRKIERNLELYNIEKRETPTSLEYSATNIKPIVVPYLAPDPDEFLPLVRLRPRKFELAGVSADVDTWEGFGKWQYANLLKGQDELDKEVVREIDDLVRNVESPKEKTKMIYNYMQDKSRYVFVGIGIGGWKPARAMDVHELSYGDCKGLTNYTMALLKSQGIESYYTIVESGDDGQDLKEDFVAMQGNHVILTVPMEDEMVFLECTSQQIPFNYLGDFTDNRRVLMITPEGGEFITTHKYATEQNLQEANTKAVLTSDLVLSGTYSQRSEGLMYNHKYLEVNSKENEQKLRYKHRFGHLNNLELGDIQLRNDKEQIVFEEQLNFRTTNYVVRAGDRVLFNPNIFNRYDYLPKPDSDRQLPIEIRRGKTYKDVIEIEVPSDFEVEAVFDPIHLQTDFGTYTASIKKVDPTTLEYSRALVLEEGRFPKESYPDYVEFIQQVVKNDKSKIVLKRL
ncbi:MAG: DUF3857 domain-containing protein [Marinirhabdus sp.]|nr:DUF3857 domain-containing protein [Marinirhabdus sp.]